jgi:hypothetical protein
MTEQHLTSSDIGPGLQFIEERERRLHDIEGSYKFAEEHQCGSTRCIAPAYGQFVPQAPDVVLHRGGRPREAVAAARQVPALVLLRGLRMALSKVSRSHIVRNLVLTRDVANFFE